MLIGFTFMPLKNGHLTPQETRFVEAMADTGNVATARRVAGVSQPLASMMSKRPGVQQAIVEAQIAALNNELLPLAIAKHRQLLTDPRTPAGAAVQAVKLAYDRTLGLQDNAGRDKEPHEMSPEELAIAIHNLEKIKAERARPVLELEANETGVFD
jgi:hypothetical protein